MLPRKEVVRVQDRVELQMRLVQGSGSRAAKTSQQGRPAAPAALFLVKSAKKLPNKVAATLQAQVLSERAGDKGTRKSDRISEVDSFPLWQGRERLLSVVTVAGLLAWFAYAAEVWVRHR